MVNKDKAWNALQAEGMSLVMRRRGKALHERVWLFRTITECSVAGVKISDR